MDPASDTDNERHSHPYSNGNLCVVPAVEVMIAEIWPTWMFINQTACSLKIRVGQAGQHGQMELVQ
jgi:hypothetical protein